MIPVLIVNLKRDADRRQALASRLDAIKVPHRFHEAVDGRALSAEAVARHSPRNRLAFARALMPNEVAAGVSHLAAIRVGVDLDTPYFCVLEDDVIPAGRFAESLDARTLASLPSFDALRLFTHLDRWDKPSKTVASVAGSVVVRMLRPGWGCAGQIYSRPGAGKILSAMQYISAPMDYALYHDCHVMGLRVLETRPGLIDHADAPSSVGDRSGIPDAPRGRTGRNAARVRRKIRAGVSFLNAWGVRELVSFFPNWR